MNKFDKWALIINGELSMSLCETRECARDFAKSVRRVAALHKQISTVKVVKVEVRIKD